VGLEITALKHQGRRHVLEFIVGAVYTRQLIDGIKSGRPYMQYRYENNNLMCSYEYYMCLQLGGPSSRNLS
jgi:hypothetical protein